MPDVELQFDVEGIAAAMQEKARERALAAAQVMRDYIVDQMRSSKSGQTYRLPNGQTYTASAAGEYPAVATGDLVASIQAALVGEDAAAVGSNQLEAAEVEKIRPWLSRAAVELEGQLQQVMLEGWDQ